jgi:hypothetical protein
VDSVANAFSPRVARTSWRFFPRRLLHRRQPLQEHWPPAGQEGSKTEKLDNPKYQIGPLISPKAIAASGQQHKQWVPKAISYADGSRGNQDQTGPRRETSVDDDAKHSMERGPEEVAEK